MKNLILLITFLIPSLNFAQEIIVDEYLSKVNLADYKLFGKIERITSTAIDANGNTTTLPFLENEFYNQITLDFNKKGLLTKRINYLDYSNKLAIYSFTENNYDNNNRLNQQKKTVINNNEDPLRIASLKTYSYDINGNIIFINEVLKGKTTTSIYQTEFIYSDKLNEIVTKINQKIVSKNQLTYNKKGLLIKNETISFDGKKGLKKYYIYDGIKPIYVEEYNDEKQQIAFNNIDFKTSKFQQFDQNNNLKTEFIYNSNHQIIEAKNQSFKQGNPILKEYHLSYQLDPQGNWIACEVKSEGIITYLITRKITYYN